jgi:hypothetical protein
VSVCNSFHYRLACDDAAATMTMTKTDTACGSGSGSSRAAIPAEPISLAAASVAETARPPRRRPGSARRRLPRRPKRETRRPRLADRRLLNKLARRRPSRRDMIGRPAVAAPIG